MKKQSTTKSFAVLSAAQIISKVLSVVYLPFLINILGDKGYGMYAAAYIVYAFIYVVTNSGIPVAISKIMSELFALENYKDAVKSFKIARTMLLALGIIMSALMFFLATPLAAATKSKSSALAIKALAPTVLFTSILTAYRGYFQGRSNMTPTAISQVIEQIINTVFSLVFATILVKNGPEMGAAGGTIGTSLGACVASVYLVMVYHKNRHIKVPKGYNAKTIKRYSNKKLVKKILNYSIPMTVCIGLQNAGALVDLWNVKSRLISAGFVSVTEELFGWLSKYNSLINVPIAIISCLAAALLPAISGAAALNDKKEVGKKINYAFRLCFLISIPAAFGLAVLSKPIYELLHVRGGYMLMLLGSSVVILMSVVQIQTTILQGIGKLYLVTLYAILGLLGKIITNYILVGIAKINILGAVAGNIVCFLIPLFLNYITINRVLRVRVNLYKNMKKPLIASIIMSIAVLAVYVPVNAVISLVFKGYISNAIATLAAIGVGALIYLYSLIVFRGITKKDLETVPNKLIRLLPKKMISQIK
ncbi:polysaccharide biosynthesis protein [Clostridium sp. KNHs214]|uniref:putative polysaccharide biosynthesis protein n=1 Tax=Clostridium sp. KNHs214 TaxID=1540257 RepID=UPI00054CE100|nr:polysaccharide biosynthesis protein [Clostridium sp. KNHs214]